MIFIALLISLQLRVVLPPGGYYRITKSHEYKNFSEYQIPDHLLSRIPENLRWRLNWVLKEASKVPPDNVSEFRLDDYDNDDIPDLAVRSDDRVIFYKGPDFIERGSLDLDYLYKTQVLKFHGLKEIFKLDRGKIYRRFVIFKNPYPDTVREKLFDVTLPFAPYPAVINRSRLAVSTLNGFYILQKRGRSWDTVRVSPQNYMKLQRVSGKPYFISKDGSLFELVGNRLVKIDSIGEKVYFGGRWVEPSDLPVKADSATSIISGDINSDGIDDIVAGKIDGFIKIFISPDYDTLMTLKVGEHPSVDLFDFDGDSLPDIIAGDIEGNLTFFKNTGTRTNPFFVESGSWEFAPTYSIKKPGDYYDHYIPVRRELKITKKTLLDTLINFLERINSPYFDEVVYSVAHTPPGVLRAMARMGNLDIFVSSAKSIYKMADSLPYVRIEELDNGLTTLVYDDSIKLPVEYYYLFVVHPRILFEIPARINASFWDKPPEYYGISEDEWLKKEVDVYKDGGVFWRDYFSGLKEIKEKMQKAKTEREAVLTLHRWLSWSYKGNFMRFGYKTQDIQPMVIFKKRYGSCGEQSILLAAFARTYLIPIYVVMDRGEDHQWNEFWENGRWHHWDLNFKAEKAIDHPMTSAEGMGAPRNPKTVSAVLAWHPDDNFHPVTRRYTDVAHVKVKVVDKDGIPIEGALVVPRSHWNNRNSISIWGYTDKNGEVSFDLGYEPLGYTFDVVSPAGMTGMNYFFINEGENYELTLKVPGKFHVLNGEADSSIFTPVNFITGKPYRIKSDYLREKIRYNGAGKTPIFFDGGKIVVKETDKMLEIFNPSPDHYRIVKINVNAKPEIVITPEKKEIYPGEPVVLKAKIFPFHYFKKFEILMGDSTFEVFPRRSGKHYKITVPNSSIYPGRKEITLKGYAHDGRELTASTYIEVKGTNFLESLVYQDECTSEHPSGSFIYGPFFVTDSIPFIFLKVTSDAYGADIDIFLFRDKNGNGKIDSMKELVKKSTTPLSTEKIFIPYPEKGTYWLYVQGCTIPEPPVKFRLETSFHLNSDGKVIFP